MKIIQKIPGNLIHGTVTGLVGKALDNDGLFKEGYNAATLEGYATFFATPEHEGYAEEMAYRKLMGETNKGEKLRQDLRNYSIGDMIILEFFGGVLPPMSYKTDARDEKNLFTNDQIYLAMLAENSRRDVESIFREKAANYFESHPLPEENHGVRIVEVGPIRRLSLFKPEERQEMKDLIQGYRIEDE